MSSCATSRDGAAVRTGDWVYYCGSLTAHRGQIMRITDINPTGRLTLETAVGDHLRNVRGQSVRPDA